ncbi:MAG: hypothetical protein KGL39_55400 [Patescibacteria group bacterium]|nr:hypothetical protein [Patescibacteria group bacterium]
MSTVNPMTTVGDTVTIKLPRERHIKATINTLAASRGYTAVGDTVVFELSSDGGVSWNNAIINKPDATTSTTGISGPGQAGWTEAGGATHARARLTTITSGAAIVNLDWRK